MKIEVPSLKKGDLIEIIAPAKAIEKECVFVAKTFLEKEGFNVKISEHCLGQEHYFSGSLAHRLLDAQNSIDNDDVKAILCARGGYGCVQLVDIIQWANLLRNPKWLIGFSDVTVFHQHLNKIGIPSIHGSMPLNFKDNSDKALHTLVQALKKEDYSITSSYFESNRLGHVQGTLLGGNLSIICSLIGTNNQPNYQNSILFIEEISEQLYHIDRMFFSLEKSGILDQISGLIVGSISDTKDTIIPFGKSVEEIILSHFEFRKIPICFHFPAGHINDNQALILGRMVHLKVSNEGTELAF